MTVGTGFGRGAGLCAASVAAVAGVGPIQLYVVGHALTGFHKADIQVDGDIRASFGGVGV